jgi:transposase-like protein
MSVHKKENSTPQNNATPSTIVSSEDLKPEHFHHYLRAEIRQATRMVMEDIIREELSGFLGAKWGESTPERKGYRNGFYTRDLMTTAGPIEDVNVPRDLEGQFHTQAFEQYNRYAPQVARSA